MKHRWVFVCFASAACASPTGTPLDTPGFPSGVVHAKEDPTVHGARFVPESVDLSNATFDSSGSARWVLQGMRFLSSANGALRSATDRLDDLTLSLPLPARLGGGFLFVIHDTVYRADDWLAPPRPIFRSLRGIAEVFAGLDRAYVRTRLGAHVAFDPRTGATLDLGPWPHDPFVGSYAALDGWRALALTDIRGAVATTDAGRSWVALDLPIRTERVLRVRYNAERGTWLEVATGESADAFVVSDQPLHEDVITVGVPASRAPPPRCYVVSSALAVTPLASCDDVERERHEQPGRTREADSAALETAVEDGWPLEDGTALVAKDGGLARVSLNDGKVSSVANRVFRGRGGACHALPLARPGAASFGFVCGEPRGTTVLSIYDDAIGRLRVLREFATPRVVQVSGNGAWLVHGACGYEGPSAESASTYCVGTPSRTPGSGAFTWRDVRVEGTPGAAVTITSDDRVAWISAPENLDAAQVVFTRESGKADRFPLHLSEPSDALRRFISRAVWLGSLEERRPGTLSGWLAADGTVVGVEIDPDGGVRTGAYVRDLGSPFVAGRYGLGWTHGRRGYETTDGGMTWIPIVAPVALAPSRVRACGPAGCVADGWIRVGWGEHTPEALPPLTPEPPARNDTPNPLRLVCQATESKSPPTPSKIGPAQLRDPGTFFIPFSPFAGGPDSSALHTDAWFSPPRLTRADRLLQVDVFHGAEATPRWGPLARVYVWGPTSGDWGGLGRWVVRWRSPFAALGSVVSSAEAPAPFQDAEGARAELGIGRAGPAFWTLTVAEDPSHALLLTRRPGRTTEVTALDEGGAQVPIRRADGEPWGLIDATLRIGSEWFVAAPTDVHRTTVALFRADAGGARRLATIRRLYGGPTSAPVRLARGEGGQTLGVVVDGEPSAERSGARLWVVPVGIESGDVGSPELLGAADLSDRDSVGICADDGGGRAWVLDTSWTNANVDLQLDGPDGSARLRRIYARLRLSSDRACVERLAGEANDEVLDNLVRAHVDHRAPGGLGTPEATLPLILVGDRPLAFVCEQGQK